jgi:hypothetical protein
LLKKRPISSPTHSGWWRMAHSTENKAKAVMEKILEGILSSPHAGLGGCQSSISSQANNSPANPGSHCGQGHGTPLTRFSSTSKYPDIDPHDGFNPNYF